MEIQGKVGPAGTPGDSSIADPRFTRELATVVGELRGRYYEGSSRGQIFTATTAAAGIAPGTALSATPALAIVNPVGTGKNIEILKAFYGYVSGTLGIGQLWWTQGVAPASLPAETTAAIRSSTLLTGNTLQTNDIAKAYSGISLTNTPVSVRPSAFALNPYVGTAAPLTLQPLLYEPIEGELIVTPGAYLALEGLAAAGSTPLVLLAITYAIVQP